MKKTFNEFNLIIAGVGGQGLITLLRIINEAAFTQGYETRSSELHGLSQRGGSVEVHLRFGQKIFSPLVSQGKANLIVSLESQEALNAAFYASNKTNFLVNVFQTPTLTKNVSSKKVKELLSQVSPKVFFLAANGICQKELGSSLVAGIFLLGYASFHQFIPLNENSILAALKEIIPKKFLEINLKAFALAKKAL